MTRRLVPGLALAFCGAFAGFVWAQKAEERAEEHVVVEAAAHVPADDGLNLGVAADAVVERTNAFREAHDLPPLKQNGDLRETAAYFAQYMAETDSYGHGADGNSPAQRAEEHGYDYCVVLENIAYAYDSAGFDQQKLIDQFFEGWRDSPTHRENMLDPDVTETGLAIARSEKTGVYYGVQMFGLPRSAAVEFSVVNSAGQEVKYRLGDQTLTLPPRVTRTHTVCRPQELTFPFAGESIERPSDGTTYAVVGGAQGLRVDTR